MDKVLVIAGSTGTGKSRLAVRLAHLLDGEIISGDSMQVYRGMDIGTAKVTKEEMEGIPHHLLDIREPWQPYDVRQFQQLARQAIADVQSRGRLPILCGGTGLYLKAALYDYVFEEQEEDEDLRRQLEAMDPADLYRRLQDSDPASAAAIHPNNRKRILRALMIAASGKTKSDREREQTHTPLYDVFWLGLEKEDNEQALKQRIGKMDAAGLEQEAASLFSDPSTWTLTAFQGIGYKEWRPYFEHRCSKEEVLEQIFIHTRKYAKRQKTWFRHQMPMRWYGPEEEDRILEDVRRWLDGQ